LSQRTGACAVYYHQSRFINGCGMAGSCETYSNIPYMCEMLGA
jgi:hypothetical protein